MANLNEHLTAGEAAAYLGVAKITLRQWDRAGGLKARRHPITGYRLYLKKELDAILVGASKPEETRARARKRRAKR
ncbi:MAG: MerR family DNA-binding transcriptional regulator [Phycisphaerae bacterium]